MYNERITLTPQELLDKEFKIDARGYRPQEVDKFLDLVINDYNEFITEIKELKKALVDIFYLEVEDFLKICSLSKRIFPIFCIFVDGKLVWKKCGFISYTEISNEFTKKSVLFS